MPEYIHKITQPSLLSRSELTSASFSGLFNLSLLLLVALNLRLVIENLIKYGILIRVPTTEEALHLPAFWGYIILYVFLPIYFRFVRTSIHRWIIIVLTGIIIHLIASLTDPPLLISLCLLMFTIVILMKLISYTIEDGYTNRLVDIYTFLLTPTLIYQKSYPKLEKRSLSNILRYILQFIFEIGLLLIISEQYIRPILFNLKLNVYDNISSMSTIELILSIIERFLKLCVPFLYLWIVMFFTIFHTWLNLLAELTLFGDCRFYDDWWNSKTIGEYWRKWNLPVHNWFKLYCGKSRKSTGKSTEAKTSQVNRLWNLTLVFFISGVLHEYLVVVPLKLPWNGIVTIGFMFQVVLVYMGQWFKDRAILGNLFFWFVVSFSAQPLSLMIFFILKMHML